MAGRILPAIKPRPPQRQSPPALPEPKPRRLRAIPTWRTGDKVLGDKVLWQGYSGTFLREIVDDHAEVLIGTRTYRLPKAELRPAGVR